MLPWLRDDRPSPKCIYTRSALPSYVDRSQPPQKRKPFSSMRGLAWAHTVDLNMPTEDSQLLEGEIAHLKDSRYAKVIMKFGDILDGEFFNEYIKKGNILMLSEGRPGVDNIFELREGRLHISLDHATYERAGLQGQAVPDGGVKHKKNRFAIDIDLRPSSVLHGKKGFERIVWAAKNVLNSSLTWLFFDCTKQSSHETDTSNTPIDIHHPRWFALTPTKSILSGVSVPSSICSSQPRTDLEEDAFEDEDFAESLDEWLSLLSLQSPIVQSSTPKPDPYICRYSLPEPDANHADDSITTHTTDIARLRWTGFLPTEVLLEILFACLKAVAPAKQVASQEAGKWLALQVHGFSGQSLTLHMTGTQAGCECFEWDHTSHK